MSRPVSIQSRFHRLLILFCGVLAAVMVSMLALLQLYNGQYRALLDHVTAASSCAQGFRQGGQGALSQAEVSAVRAQALSLLDDTAQATSRVHLEQVPALCDQLSDTLQALSESPENGALAGRAGHLAGQIETALSRYLHAEAMELQAVQRRTSRQVAAEIALFIVLSATLVAALVAYSRRLSRTVTRPIAELSRRAEDVFRGDLIARPPVESDACEVSTLSAAMEAMIARLSALLQETGEKQESLRKAELALLQAQMNPHFLYNTLDTIMWLIEAGRADAAVEMVSDLSDFFRHSLSRGRDVITLAEETNHVRSYLHIQQARYQDVLDYEIAVDPSLGRAMIPKLTLQPLVENALYHGIKQKRARGRIRVLSQEAEGDILLRIVDDGAGMEPARLEQLRRALEVGERVGFGLSTVHERLRLLFGAPYGLTLDSAPGVGSTVTVRIPNTPMPNVE